MTRNKIKLHIKLKRYSRSFFTCLFLFLIWSENGPLVLSSPNWRGPEHHLVDLPLGFPSWDAPAIIALRGIRTAAVYSTVSWSSYPRASQRIEAMDCRCSGGWRHTDIWQLIWTVQCVKKKLQDSFSSFCALVPVLCLLGRLQGF